MKDKIHFKLHWRGNDTQVARKISAFPLSFILSLARCCDENSFNLMMDEKLFKLYLKVMEILSFKRPVVFKCKIWDFVCNWLSFSSVMCIQNPSTEFYKKTFSFLKRQKMLKTFHVQAIYFYFQGNRQDEQSASTFDHFAYLPIRKLMLLIPCIWFLRLVLFDHDEFK